MDKSGHCQHAIEFVTVGHFAVDRSEGNPGLGGAAAYSALAAHRLGLSVAAISAVGEDFDFFDSLEGIEVHYHRSGSSTTFVNTYTDDNRKQRLLSRAQTLRVEDLRVLDSRLAEDAIVLYCPVANEVEMPLKRLVPKGICGVAPQGYFRRWGSGGYVYASPWHNAPEELQQTDCLTLSQDDPPQLESFLQGIVDLVPIVAVTEGQEGVRLYSKRDAYHVPALRREAVDPTGAGDVFAATFLIALREGRPMLDAARFGCGVASFAVEKPGILGIPPSREAIEGRIDS